MMVFNHSVDFEVQQTWSRLNNLSWTYYNIAEAAYDDFLAVEPSVEPLADEEDPAEYFDKQSRLLSASFRTIVFSAMACEAAIYDLAAIQLGDGYTSQYIDKLDLLAKWILVPSLICGKGLKENGPAINGLRTLVRTRNALVHHKSMPAFPVEESIRKADNQLEKILQETGSGFKTVVLLSLELNQLLGTSVGVLPFFEKNTINASCLTDRARISSVIARCREINANNKS